MPPSPPESKSRMDPIMRRAMGGRRAEVVEVGVVGVVAATRKGGEIEDVVAVVAIARDNTRDVVDE